jgi:sugar O-acyltransferase (sialic acid O-acetyltransferase NeuD family)
MILAIFGAGSLGKEVLSLAKQINATQCRWKQIVLVADYRTATTAQDLPLMNIDEVEKQFGTAQAKFVIGVGEPSARQLLYQRVTERGFSLETLIHPTAHIGEGSVLEPGTIVNYGCFVSCQVEIGQNVLLQPLACVGHGTQVGAHSVLSTYSSLAGSCRIGERVFIGMNTPVREEITIGADTIISMGAVVMNDIPEGVVAMGNPARAMRKNTEHKVFK